MPLNLFSAPTVDAALDGVIAPWFCARARDAWRSAKPTVVLVPNQVQAHRLRQLIAGREIPALNVRFWRPADLRAHFAQFLALPLPLEDATDRAVLLQSAAEEVLAQDPSNKPAAAVAAAPDSLRETLDLIESGGWGDEELPGTSMQPVLAARRAALAVPGRCSPSAFSAMLDQTALRGSIASLLVVGFTAAHWAEWGTLRAAACAADDATVLLQNPRQKAEEIDLVWLASWESLGGTIEPIDALPGNSDLAAGFEAGDPFAPADNQPVFIVGEDVRAEAEAAVAAAGEALTATADGAVALIIPEAGILAQEIVALLDDHQIPYFNGVPAYRPKFGSAVLWEKLIACITRPTVQRFLAFADDPAGRATLPVDHAKVERMVRTAIDALAVTDIPMVAQSLIASSDSVKAQVGDYLVKFGAWPVRASLAIYIDQLAGLLNSLNLTAMAADVNRLRLQHKPVTGATVRRASASAWLLERLRGAEAERSKVGSHPYARLQLVTPTEAAGLEWKAVVLVGQNEGVWPPAPRACAFLGQDALDALNRRVRALNEQARGLPEPEMETSPVLPGRALCIGPALAYALILRDFANLVEYSGRMTLTASLRDPASAGKQLNLGDLFARLFQIVRGRQPRVADVTSLAPTLSLPAAVEVSAPPEEFDHTAKAFRARRTKNTPFDVYEFCLAKPANWPVKLAATDWERVAERPADAFMRAFVGLRPPESLRDLVWPRICGIWAHEWISRANGAGPTPLRDAAPWVDRVDHEARLFRTHAAALFAANGRSLPAWWQSLWDQAGRMAKRFASSLDAVTGYAYALSEVKIPLTKVRLPSGLELPVHGRTDLVFSDRLPNGPEDYSDCNLLVLDFKTGTDKPLKIQAVQQGKGVQLPLYGLALKELNAASVGMGIVKPGADAAAQLTAGDLQALEDLWEKYAAMLAEGRFGRLEPYRQEFGFGADFPIACLEPGTDLAAKFALSNPTEQSVLMPV